MSVLSVSAMVLDDACSCITKATAQDLTPQIYENMGATAYGSQRIYANAARDKMIGVAPTMLQSFLLGTVSDVKEKLSEVSIGGDRFVNLPYLVRRRDSNITNEYFEVTARADTANTATTGESALTIETITDSLFDAQNGSPIYKQFLPGQSIYIKYYDAVPAAGSQTSYQVPFKIVTAEAGANDATATVTVVPFITPAGWAALSAGEKTALQPETGLVTIGVNNVDDYEQYCDVESVEIAPSFVIDYIQTMRGGFCYTKEFAEMVARIENDEINDFYKTFKYLPTTQRMRIVQQKERQKWFQSIFYNGPLNELQSPNVYTAGSTPDSLTVKDPNDPTCVLGYKANALGIEPLLATQGQVLDLKGGDLNLRTVLEYLYTVKRNRENDGARVESIAAFTSQPIYDRIVQTLISHIKARYSTDLTLYYQPGEMIDNLSNVSMSYSKFALPEFGFHFVIAHDNFFTDRERMVKSTGLGPSHAGEMWVLDMPDITTGIVATNSVKINENDEMAAKFLDSIKCTMAQNTIYRTLESKTWTVRIGNEKRHLLVKGFNVNGTITFAQ